MIDVDDELKCEKRKPSVESYTNKKKFCRLGKTWARGIWILENIWLCQRRWLLYIVFLFRSRTTIVTTFQTWMTISLLSYFKVGKFLVSWNSEFEECLSDFFPEAKGFLPLTSYDGFKVTLAPCFALLSNGIFSCLSV